MKNELKEYIKLFENEALKYPVNSQKEEHYRLVQFGYTVALKMIEDNLNLIRPTILGTMIAVKKEYRDLSKSAPDYKKISAISLVVNSLQRGNEFAVVEKDNKRYAEWYKQLTNAKKKQMQRNKNDVIWALNGQCEY